MKQNYLLHILLFTLINFSNAFATDYYIDPTNGNDGNNGLSNSNAFKSLYKIDNINLQPGDTVFFMEGNYQRSGQTLLTINESGTSENWITFKNYENHTPVLEFNSWTGIDIIGGSSFIKIDGLHIKGTRSIINLDDALIQSGSCGVDEEGNANGLYNGTGILAVGPNLTWSNSATSSVPHHISVTNCEIYDCSSSGIAFQQADYVTVTNNKVYDNCWYTIYGTSGINLYQFVNTDGTTGFHNEISNNLMYGNQLLVPQVPYCSYLDGNGFIIDDFKHTQTGNYKNADEGYEAYSAKTLVSNNISVENGGSGLHFYLSENCYIYNNTVVNNASQNEGVNGNAELRIGNCSDFVIKNNVFKGEDKIHAVGNNSNMDYTHNYQYGPTISSNFAGCDDCIEETDIDFLNTDVYNDSPFLTDFTGIFTDSGIILEEINSDYLNNSRPNGNSFDIGAYELYNSDDCTLSTWYADADNDNLGDLSDSISACEQPDGYVETSGDLCPTDSNKTEPGECGCDIQEGDCEEACENPTNWYADADNDGFGDADDVITDCEQPDGYVENNADLCANDSLKTEPGDCGCGVEEGTCSETGDLCDSPEYSSTTVYALAGTTVIYNGNVYENKWYTKGLLPTSGGPWELVTFCNTELTDCSFIDTWSSSIVYSGSGNQVVYNQGIYENKWHISGGIPGVNPAWQMIGFCASADTISATANYAVSVLDLTGNSLLNTQTTSTNSTDINMSTIDNGIYIIHFTNIETGATTVEKISK